MSKKSNLLITTLFWVGVALVVGNVWLSGFTSKLQFGKLKIKPKGFTFDLGVLFDIVMPITNKNSQSVTINKFVGALWYGPVKLATLDQRQPITLTAGATTDFIIEASINLEALPADVKAQLQNGQYLQNFFLKGNMTIGSLTVPINEMLTILF